MQADLSMAWHPTLQTNFLYSIIDFPPARSQTTRAGQKVKSHLLRKVVLPRLGKRLDSDPFPTPHPFTDTVAARLYFPAVLDHITCCSVKKIKKKAINAKGGIYKLSSRGKR